MPVNYARDEKAEQLKSRSCFECMLTRETLVLVYPLMSPGQGTPLSTSC